LRQTGSTAGPVPFAKQWSSADLALYPIVQERLTNTLKHAHASHVEVDIR
jgi:signal transduction histidine kinase